MPNEIKFEIVNHIGVVSKGKGDWSLELNRISWNGREPKYDLRSWSFDHQKMSKGVTLSGEEIVKLKDILMKEAEYIQNDGVVE